MKSFIRTLLILASVAPALVNSAFAQQQAPPLTIEKVKDNLYVIVGSGGNVGALVTREGVILIDDKFEPNYDEIMEKLRSVTSQPVKYVINTHYHADHSGGNVKFLPSAEVISTLNARKNILDHKQPNAPANLAPARIVFTEETSVFLGGMEVRARHFGRGHTNGDAVIYFPELRTIHTGDLMSGTTPLIDYNGGGSVVEWTRTLDAVLQMDFETVIPGHGPVNTKAGLKSYRDNIEKLRNRVSGLIREGKSQEEIGKVLMAEFGWQPNSLQMEWSLPGFFQELK
ncbi:MAG: MBL fold metallo-hydrolase [Acidobacteria bacterium]|nr:MBL fold metallo-hydrolase [Acidobacteriota bacterium]